MGINTTMKKHYGLGVLFAYMSDHSEEVDRLDRATGKTIKKIKLENNALWIRFTDGAGIKVFDDGQSCCEHRYMTTDDDLSAFVGARFLEIEIREAPSLPNEWGEHEVQFLLVNTSLGTFTMETHNEHNGYYSGFWIAVHEW